MIVNDQDYDEQAPAMRENTVPALTWELAAADETFAAVPLVRLPPETAWICEYSTADGYRTVADWRFLIPAKRALARPALARLDLRFPDGREISIRWTVLTAEDFVVLGIVALADLLGFQTEIKTDAGLLVRGLYLADWDDYHQLAAHVRGPMLLNALSEYVYERRQPPA